MGTFIIVGIVVLFVIAIPARRRSLERRLIRSNARHEAELTSKGSALKAYLHRIPNFRFTHCLLSRNYHTAVALEENTGRLCLIDAASPDIYHRLYPASDLLSVSLVEYDQAREDSPGDHFGDIRTDPILEILFTVGGAIIRGLWAAGASLADSPMAGRLELQLKVNDTRAPLWRVIFLITPLRKNSPAYAKARETALQWQALLEVLIRRAHGAALAAPAMGNILPPSSGGTTMPLSETVVYRVQRNGKDIGVMPLSRIRALLRAGHLTTRDRYFDPQLQDWLTLDLLPESVL